MLTVNRGPHIHIIPVSNGLYNHTHAADNGYITKTTCLRRHYADLRVYGKSAHVHLKFAQNFAVKLVAKFCSLQPTSKYIYRHGCPSQCVTNS